VKKRQLHFAGLAVLTFLFATSCQKSSPSQDATAVDTAQVVSTMNVLSEQEKAEGWELLFDGNSLNGWKRFNHDTIGPLWTVQEGVIVCDGQGLGEGTADIGGSLITTRSFGNFELSIDWKLSPGGNSGIIYHVVEDPKYKHDYETGPEFQIMDDAGWKDELKEAQKVGSNYDMYPAAPTKKVNAVGEWNNARLVYNNGHVEHWLNGEKVVEFDEGSPDFTERYKKSKWVDYPDWNKVKSGAISLQDHGAPVYFRNIKIKAL
jgi:3-keto-disaccharide hydrolase